MIDQPEIKAKTNDLRATFFCVGELAVQFPEVVKRIAAQGHEIGSHSNRHLWVTKMDRKAFQEDTKRAICSLEDLTGKKVRSFRQKKKRPMPV